MSTPLTARVRLGAPLTILILVLVIVAGYLHTLGYPFQFDDLASIRDNPTLDRPAEIAAIWRFHPPRFVVYLSFAWNAALTARSPAGLRVVNLLIHLAAALLVGWIGRELAAVLAPRSGSRRRAAPDLIGPLAALIFAAHPLATQAVTYLVQRSTSLAALFELAAIALYLRARAGLALAPWAMSWACAALAAFTKEMAVGLPLAIALLEIAVRRSNPSAPRPPALRLTPYLLVVPAVVLLSRCQSDLVGRAPSALPMPAGYTPLHYLLTQLSVIPRYLALVVWPQGQNLDPDVRLRTAFDGAALVGAAIILAVLALAFRARRGRPLVALGVVWFFVLLLPESSVIPISDLMNEHRTYLPLAGMAWAGAAALAEIGSLGVTGWAIPAALVLTLTALTHVRNLAWRDGLTLWEDAARKSPGKARPQNNYGLALREAGRLGEAEAAFRRALAAEPGYVLGRINLASLYRQQRRYAQAIQLLEETATLTPGDWRVFNNLGTTRWAVGDTAAAAVAYERAVALAPERPEPAENLARLRGLGAP